MGAAYLCWLAVQVLRNGTALRVEDRSGTGRKGLAGDALTGFLVNLSNPKVVVFFITFLPGFVSAADPDAAAKLWFLGLWFVAMTAVLSVFLILSAERFVAGLRAGRGCCAALTGPLPGSSPSSRCRSCAPRRAEVAVIAA